MSEYTPAMTDIAVTRSTRRVGIFTKALTLLNRNSVQKTGWFCKKKSSKRVKTDLGLVQRKMGIGME